jgi:hypothetical protein
MEVIIKETVQHIWTFSSYDNGLEYEIDIRPPVGHDKEFAEILSSDSVQEFLRKKANG